MRNEENKKMNGRSFDREGRFRDQERDLGSNYYNHRQERWSNSERPFGDSDRTSETMSPDSSYEFGRRDMADLEGGESLRGGSNYSGMGPKGWKRSDERIREEACEVLYHAASVDASEIEVTVKEACVTLKGTVESREAKREAERVIDRISGVDDIHNELRVSCGMENSPTMNSALNGTSASHSKSSKLS